MLSECILQKFYHWISLTWVKQIRFIYIYIFLYIKNTGPYICSYLGKIQSLTTKILIQKHL